MLKYLLLLFCICAYSQNHLTSTELSKLDYPELGKLYLEKDIASKKIIAKFFLQKAKKENNHYNTAIGYWYKSVLSEKEDDIVKSIDSMLYYSKKCLPSKYMLAFSYLTKARHYTHKRKYKIGLDNYILANTYLRKTDDENLYYNIQFDIAVIKSSLFNYKETLPVFIEFQNYCKKINDKWSELTAVFAIAESHNRLGNLKSAKHYTEYGKEMSLLLKDSIMYNKLKCCEGINLYKEKKYSQSIPLLKITLKKLEEDFANYSMNCFYLSKSYLAVNNQEKAIVYFKKIDSIFMKENVIFLENIPAYTHLISYYEARNDTRNQLYYTNNLIKADSVVHSNYEYLTEKIHKDYDIPKLIKNKESLISKLNGQKQNYIITICLFSILALVLVFFFIRYSKKQKEQYKEQLKAFEVYKEAQLKKHHSEPESKKIENKQSETTIIIQDEIVNAILKKLTIFEKEKKYLQKDCTLDKLAKEMETNMSYLSKIINEKKESSFPNYINGLRIDYAVYKLENEKLFRKYSIKGLADSLGFNTAESFSRAFKNKMNMNPSFFIEQLKAGNYK